jgi:hypothetical protein
LPAAAALLGQRRARQREDVRLAIKARRSRSRPPRRWRASSPSPHRSSRRANRQLRGSAPTSPSARAQATTWKTCPTIHQRTTETTIAQTTTTAV